jgi:hypothetical protein|nr:MAG TPA: zinc-ribbon domain protein [Caudoviricetes sp.]
MINVIKLGDTTIGECENCGCRFAYGEESIQNYNLYAGNELKAVISYINCPRCGKQHKVK